MATDEKTFHSLIPLDDFKAVMCIDDRDDAMARFCLITATYTIEQFCRRRLLQKKHFERIGFCGDLFLPLREYPVSEVLVVYVLGNGEMLEPDFYRVFPDCGIDLDLPFSLELSPAVARMGCTEIKTIYWAGYAVEDVPVDLVWACLELASWNFSPYRGKRVGMTGNLRGAGKEGEHFEMAMPENVRGLLEPYTRRVI